MLASWKLERGRITAEVHPLGAMLGRVAFILDDGRSFEPFKVAPWSERPEAVSMPPVMRYLRGEFACVPFGAAAPPPTATERWISLWVDEPAFTETHGPAANRDWTLLSKSPSALTAAIDYPEEHPIRRAERTIALGERGRSIYLGLRIFARRLARIAVGVHPIFDVGDLALDTEIDVPFSFGWTFPGDYVPGASILARDARFTTLDAVPLRSGDTIGLRQHPLRTDAEDVVQLCGVEGRLRLRRRSLGIAIDLVWSASDFPSVILGVANGGRKGAPFDGAWRALYVEPVASAFGVGSTIAANPQNPIARAGSLRRSR